MKCNKQLKYSNYVAFSHFHGTAVNNSGLETFGLVQKKKRGFGLPSIIYVKSFLIQKDYSGSIESRTSAGKQILSRSTDFCTSDAIKCTSRGGGSGTSEVTESTPLVVSESAPLNNKPFV